jgi:hypothetical protein
MGIWYIPLETIYDFHHIVPSIPIHGVVICISTEFFNSLCSSNSFCPDTLTPSIFGSWVDDMLTRCRVCSSVTLVCDTISKPQGLHTDPKNSQVLIQKKTSQDQYLRLSTGNEEETGTRKRLSGYEPLSLYHNYYVCCPVAWAWGQGGSGAGDETHKNRFHDVADTVLFYCKQARCVLDEEEEDMCGQCST